MQTPSMNYLIENLDDHTARLVIRWKPNKNTTRRPSLRRHSIDSDGKWMTLPGSAFGFDRTKACAIVINVRRGDVISLSHRAENRTNMQWSHFRITRMFEMETIQVENRELQPADCDSHLFPEAALPISQLANCDDALRNFLAKPKSPAWLKTAISRQLDVWRRNMPGKFLDLAPSWATADEVANSVEINPFAALRFFKDKLSADQVDRAVRLSIEGGVLFAFERLTPAHMRKALRECPGTLLANRSDSLNDEQFEHCARFDPFVGIKMRNQVSAARHAILLARSYTLAYPRSDGPALSAFQAEIVESLINYPEAWLRAHQDNFRYLIESLGNWTHIRIDQNLLQALLVGMPKEHQPMVERYLAESI
ncbi:MAG: hypothetical protein ABI600_17220 [Luteolibacter sp.]